MINSRSKILIWRKKADRRKKYCGEKDWAGWPLPCLLHQGSCLDEILSPFCSIPFWFQHLRLRAWRPRDRKAWFPLASPFTEGFERGEEEKEERQRGAEINPANVEGSAGLLLVPAAGNCPQWHLKKRIFPQFERLMRWNGLFRNYAGNVWNLRYFIGDICSKLPNFPRIGIAPVQPLCGIAGKF